MAARPGLAVAAPASWLLGLEGPSHPCSPTAISPPPKARAVPNVKDTTVGFLGSPRRCNSFSQNMEKLPHIFHGLLRVALPYTQWDWVNLLSLDTLFSSSCSFLAQFRDNQPCPPQLPTYHSGHGWDHSPRPSAAANSNPASASSYTHCWAAKHGW